MMKYRENLLVCILAALIVAPATFAMGLHWFTNDPTLRPLSITRAKLAFASMGKKDSSILTTIRVPEGVELGKTRADLEKAINGAFDTYDAEAHFKYVRSRNSRNVSVTYSIGKSVIGPFSIKRASEGIRPAAQAHRMLVKQAKLNEQRERQNMSVLDRIFAD